MPVFQVFVAWVKLQSNKARAMEGELERYITDDMRETKPTGTCLRRLENKHYFTEVTCRQQFYGTEPKNETLSLVVN